MLFGLLLGGLGALWVAAAEQCVEPVSLCSQSQECWVFSTLTEAVEAASAKAEIAFPQKAPCEWTLTEVELSGPTYLQVVNASIAVQDNVLIQINSTLELQDTDLIVEVDGKVIVEGNLKLVNVHLQGSLRAAIIANGGTIAVHSSIFRENFGVFVITSQADISVQDSTFANNSGLIAEGVNVEPAPLSISFQKCEFKGNSGKSLFRLVRSTLGPEVSIVITECSFDFNSALLFDLSVQGLAVAFHSSTFSHNSAGGLRIKDSVASVFINNTDWTYNDNYFIWVMGVFSGTLEMHDSSMSYQSAAAGLYIGNEGSVQDCIVDVFNVKMMHFYIDSPLSGASAIFSESCIISFSNAVFTNCTNNASQLVNGIGLMFFAAGTVSLKNVSITDCGGSGLLVVLLLCSAVVDTVTVTDAAVGSDGIVVAVASVIEISSIVFEGGKLYWNQVSDITRLCLLYAEMSVMSVGNFTASDLASNVKGSILGGYASTITCSSLRIFNTSAAVAISQANSDIRIEHIDCYLCSFICFAASAGLCTAEYSHFSASDSFFSNSLFCFGSGGKLFLSNFSLSNSQGDGFITTYSSVASVVDLVMRNCRFTLLLKDMLLSEVSLTRVEVWNVEGGLLSASSSTFQLTDCQFATLRSRNDFISLSASSLTMSRSVLSTVSSRMLMRVLTESILSLHECRLNELSTTDSIMIEVIDSIFESTDTSYFDFNANLIGGIRSPVTLADSSINNGGFRYINSSSYLSHFGGVLNCIDCPSIDLIRVKIANVSADLGGALYIASIEAASNLTILLSDFSRCRANSGGVAVLQNVSFHILDSTFLNSSAEAAGGALDISIDRRHSRTIERCTFAGNSAAEGGAVKWRSAQPHFLATQFTDNSAVYGPDIASYIVQIVGYAPEIAIAPGQLTSVSYVLLDHYSAQVTTANHQLLILDGIDDVAIRGISHKVAQTGVFNFTEIEFFATPNSNHTILALFNMTSIDSPTAVEYMHSISFRSCQIGEIARNNSCEVCAEGYYSLRLDAPNCSLCPSNAHCPGGNQIILKPNAWLTSDPDNPVVDCLIEGRCDGKEENSCTEGYTGLLCGHCKEGWFPLVFSTCEKCPHASLIWIEFLFAVIIRAVIVSAFIKNISGTAGAGQLHALKSLILHAQTISLLSYVQMKVPVEVATFLHLVHSIVSMNTANFPFRCFDRSYYYNAGIASLDTPITVLIIILYFLYKRSTHRLSAIPTCNIASVLVLWSYLQCGVVLMAVLPGFSCMSVDSNSEWLIIDMAQQCWTSGHLNFIASVAAPSLAFNVILTAFLYFVLCRQLSLLSECGSLFWETFLRYLKLMCIYCVIAQAASSQSSQLFVGLLFLYFESVLNSVVVQYRSPKSLCLVQVSGFVSIASYSLMLYFPEDFGRRVAASVIFIAINLGFGATTVAIAARGYKTTDAQGDPLAAREQRSMDSLVPPNNSVVSEKGIQIFIEEFKE